MKYVLKQKGDTEESQARNAIKPGMVLYGYCGGAFGRDSYGDKIVLEVHEDHLVVREEGFTRTSFTIDGDIRTWADLIKDSNECLEQEE